MTINGVTLAPFETFREHSDRANSDTPYSAEFIARCREKAQEYSKLDDFLRADSLRLLRRAVPYHFRRHVFL